MQRTQSGGKHYFFQMPEGGYIPSLTNVGGLGGVDTRGDGGYIIIAPSIMNNGCQYQFIVPLNEPIAEAPDWLLDFIGQRSGDRDGRAISQGDVAPGFLDGPDISTITSRENAPQCFKRVASALWAIDNRTIDRGSWIAIMHAVKQAVAGDETFYDLFIVPWNERYTAPSNGTEYDRKHGWDTIQSSSVGWSKLKQIAAAHGWQDPNASADAQNDFTPLDPSNYGAANIRSDSTSPNQVSQPAWLHDLNAEWFVAPEAGRVGIWRETLDYDTGRKLYIPYATPSFKLLYANSHRATGRRTDAEAWLAHPMRHQHLKGVVFDPGKTEINKDYFNLWRGWGVDAEPGDCSLFKQHMRDVICSGNEKHYQYLWNWLAFMIQRPTERGYPAVVLFGEENRTGKGVWAKYVRGLVGKHGMLVSSPEHVIGRFNGHLRDLLVLECEEALFAKDPRHGDALKSLIGDNTIPIENKFFPVINAPNRLHVIMISNHRHVVPADMGEHERYFVLEVSAHRRGDRSYFKALCEQMDGEGLAALLHELMTTDLDGFDIREVPQTAALAEQKLHSLDDVQEWWREVLTTGAMNDGLAIITDHDWSKAPIDVSCDALYEKYLSTTARAKLYRPKSKPTFGQTLRRLLDGNLTVIRPGAPKGAPRLRRYVLPSLQQCREAFEKTIGAKVCWD